MTEEDEGVERGSVEEPEIGTAGPYTHSSLDRIEIVTLKGSLISAVAARRPIQKATASLKRAAAAARVSREYIRSFLVSFSRL